ncbi:hypothetical protein C0995_013805 [Termitomyces sp. Mi166|nr:hypothetical protein C0995_013805 [Termitomyces sp. Mi166\
MLSHRGWATILFLNIAFIISRTSLCSIGKTKYSYIGKDYPVKLPVHLDQVQATFDCSVRYALNTSIAGEIWTKSTDTRNGGFVRLGPDRRVFAVSMFHELHCVSALGRALYDTSRPPTVLDGHIGHCLNYLRMFIQCNADATEEPVVKVSTLKSQGCAPSFIRRCSNWNTLYDFLSSNYLAFHEYKVVNGTWTGWTRE